MPCPITIDVFDAVSPLASVLRAGHLQGTKAQEVQFPNSSGQVGLVLVSGTVRGLAVVPSTRALQTQHSVLGAGALFASETITRAVEKGDMAIRSKIPALFPPDPSGRGQRL